MSLFFSFVPNDGFETHEDEAKARARAKDALQYHEDEAGVDGWPENTDQICWGSISEKVLCIKEMQRPPANEIDEAGFDPAGIDWKDFDVMQEFALQPEQPLNEKGWNGSICNEAEALRQEIIINLIREFIYSESRDALIAKVDTLAQLAGAKCEYPDGHKDAAIKHEQ